MRALGRCFRARLSVIMGLGPFGLPSVDWHHLGAILNSELTIKI